MHLWVYKNVIQDKSQKKQSEDQLPLLILASDINRSFREESFKKNRRAKRAKVTKPQARLHLWVYKNVIQDKSQPTRIGLQVSVSRYTHRKEKYYVEKSHFSTLCNPFLCVYIQSSTKMAWRHFLSKKKSEI